MPPVNKRTGKLTESNVLKTPIKRETLFSSTQAPPLTTRPIWKIVPNYRYSITIPNHLMPNISVETDPMYIDVLNNKIYRITSKSPKATTPKTLNGPSDTGILGELFKSHSVSSPIIMVSGIVIFVTISLLLLISICCWRRKIKEKDIKRVLPEVLPPVSTIINVEDGFLHQHVDDLRYDPVHEKDSSDLIIGDFLDNGHFGAVYFAILRVPRNKNSCLSLILPKKEVHVVVKSAGRPATGEDMNVNKTILIRELKLLSSVGSHFNVVAFLGAITQAEKVQIIIEKCGKGDLLKFLNSLTSETFIPQYEKKWNWFEIDTYDEIQDDGQVSRKMEFYKNVENASNWHPDLRKAISTAHLFSFAMQIAQGMEYLTSIKCIHRDLAARNILITPEGYCKIADFGLAKRIVYKEYYRTETNYGLPLQWMSIEAINDEKFSVQSDIWSYGILLFEIFVLGKVKPYPSVPPPLVPEAINNGVINEQPQYCPDEIYYFMKQCWSVEVSRCPSFSKAVELFRKHLASASKKVKFTLLETLEKSYCNPGVDGSASGPDIFKTERRGPALPGSVTVDA